MSIVNASQYIIDTDVALRGSFALLNEYWKPVIVCFKQKSTKSCINSYVLWCLLLDALVAHSFHTEIDMIQVGHLFLSRRNGLHVDKECTFDTENEQRVPGIHNAT